MDKEKDNNVNAFSNFFDNFIKTGVLHREFTIADDFKLKMKVLNSEETSIAEAMFTADNLTLNDTGYLRLRSAAFIAMATVSINGIPFEEGSAPIGGISQARYSLYGYYLKMPTEVMAKIWDCYLEIAEEQREKYAGDMVEDVKNS